MSQYHQFRSDDELRSYINREDGLSDAYGKYNFEYAVFEYDIVFKHVLSKFDNIAFFKNAIFRQDADFSGIEFCDIAEFGGCEFQGHAKFENTTFHKTIALGSFHKIAQFRNAKFLAETHFPDKFNELDLAYTTFKCEVDLKAREFHKKVLIHDSVFEKDLILRDASFDKKVQAHLITIIGKLDCQWTNFRNKLTLTSAIECIEDADFFGTNFEKNAYFYNTHFGKLNLSNSVIGEGVYFLGAKINEANRETYRIIKDAFLKQNNRIEALKYHQREMSSYWIELWNSLKKRSTVSSYLRNFTNLFILSMNFLSNRYGLSILHGFLFVIIVNLICYIGLVTNLKITLDISHWQYFSQFILPTHKLEFPECTVWNDRAYIWDFVGRIVSSYGIYQFVQAFRKYGRF